MKHKKRIPQTLEESLQEWEKDIKNNTAPPMAKFGRIKLNEEDSQRILAEFESLKRRQALLRDLRSAGSSS